jgi:hypothetical protein
LKHARFVAAARREFLAEVIHYNKEQPGLGARFAAAATTCRDAVGSDVGQPQAGPLGGAYGWIPQTRVSLRSTHIWSPPVLQDSVRTLTGTGLLPYIRPVDEELACSSGLDEIGAYRPNQASGLQQP